MATPGKQAEKFVEFKVKWFKAQTKNATPTRPLEVLDKIAGAWLRESHNPHVPDCVFIYSPASANQLYQLTGEMGPTHLARAAVGLAKLHTVKANGGMIFLGVMIEKVLRITTVIVVRHNGLFIFDKPDDQYRLLTEEQWDEYADGIIPK